MHFLQTRFNGCYTFTGEVKISPFTFHLGFVYPLQDVAHHQCLPLFSVCCFPVPGGSLLCRLAIFCLVVLLTKIAQVNILRQISQTSRVPGRHNCGSINAYQRQDLPHVLLDASSSSAFTSHHSSNSNECMSCFQEKKKKTK